MDITTPLPNALSSPSSLLSLPWASLQQIGSRWVWTGVKCSTLWVQVWESQVRVRNKVARVTACTSCVNGAKRVWQVLMLCTHRSGKGKGKWTQEGAHVHPGVSGKRVYAFTLVAGAGSYRWLKPVRGVYYNSPLFFSFLRLIFSFPWLLFLPMSLACWLHLSS